MDCSRPGFYIYKTYIHMWYICTMKYNLTIKKNKILPIAMSWVDLKDIMHSETTQTEKGNCQLVASY